MKRLIILLFIFITSSVFAQTPPTIEIKSWELIGSNLFIKYTLKDKENDPCKIELRAYSKSLGGYKTISTNSASGDIGNNISTGDREINFPLPANSGSYTIDIIADDGQLVNIADLVKQVDKDKIKSDLIWLQGIRHRTAGITHLQETKDSLIHLFTKLNLDTTTQQFKYLNYQALNIIANNYGARNRQRIYINDAHYDSVANGPGADDNGTGVVGFMEIARILSAYHFENTLRFIGFDLEEVGLNGSNAYVKAISPLDSIQGVFNYEMIGYYSNLNNSQTVPTGFNILFPNEYATLQKDTFKGNFLANIGNVDSKPLSDAFILSANQYVPELKLISLNLPGTGTIAPDFRRSDHASFWDKGYKALMLTDGADFRNKNYHTANDKIDILDMEFLSNNVKATLATLATLAKPISGDVASFNVDYNAVATTNVIPNKLHIIPNPFRNELTCNIEEFSPAKVVNIYDERGRIIYYKNLTNSENEIKINTVNWPKGNYFLILNTNKGNYSSKIVKD